MQKKNANVIRLKQKQFQQHETRDGLSCTGKRTEKYTSNKAHFRRTVLEGKRSRQDS